MAVELQAGAAPRAERLGRPSKVALDILRGMAGGGRVAEQDWRAECCDGHRLSASGDREAHAKAFRRAFNDLLDKRLVEASGGEIWVATGIAPEFSAPGQIGQKPDMSDLSGLTPPGQTGQIVDRYHRHELFFRS